MLVALLLAGCGAADPAGGNAPAAGAGLCVSSACGEPELLVDLPQLENILVASNGRLFVSGQDNLYEITRQLDGSYAGTELLPAGSGCSGLAQSGNWVYALCNSEAGNGVYAFRLDTAGAPQFIYAPTGMSLPNGLVADGNTLYLTDGPVASEPKIVRLLLDGDPPQVLVQDTWLLTAPEYPNGLALRQRSLYTTLYQPGVGGTVARIEIQADGSAGEVVPVAVRDIMDDLNVYADTLLVTDWQNDAAFQIDLEGNVLQQTDPGSFAQPSCVDVAAAPLFDEPTLLVTERYSGNGLWRLRRR